MTKRRKFKSPPAPSASGPDPLKAHAVKKPGWRPFAIGAMLVIITLAAFWGVRSASFVNLDDDLCVIQNERVQGGLTWENVKWAFSSNFLAMYIPLAQLSHMLDCQLYGTKAGEHHFTSLILHILNVLLLFTVLVRTTGGVWRSGFVAALFANRVVR